MFKTTHNLPFEVAPGLLDDSFLKFKVGTCHGAWRATKETYDILAIVNHEPHNGHLTDVFEWFENSCKRDSMSLRILEVWNKDFHRHLIEKRGFVVENDYLIKRFQQKRK